MLWITLTLVAALSCVQAQLTAQSSVAPDLRECYMDSLLLNRNNLPPATISVLIDIIQQIEDTVNMDLRQLSAALLHTYRQDGIEYHQSEYGMSSSPNVLPYAPTYQSFHRHRLLLTKLIPSTQVLANNTLPSALKCALHHMISTTVDARLRGDENQCNQLSQYRALRTARHAPGGVSEDVEIMDLSLLKHADKNGQIRQYNPKSDVEFTNYGRDHSQRQLMGDSQCPLLDGVVHTSWGAISAGNVIAGISAGAEPQRVPVFELVKGSTINYQNVPDVTSIFPATISGDLAEAVLVQGTERGASTIQVGAAGGWNSTQARKHYMLQTRLNLEAADPEIRGDIDGFVLGQSVISTLQTYSSLKLSQLLDMYYSKHGVYNLGLRACNRKDLAKQYLTHEVMASETYAFAAVLDTLMPLRGTIVGGLDELVKNAVTNFQSYTVNNLNDMSCVTTDTAIRNYRIKTNLYIVIDATWPYDAVYPAISYLADQVEVGKFGSSITLLSAYDGSVLVNKTFSQATFHANYTLQRHQSIMTGVDLTSTLTNIKTLMHRELQRERDINYVGGNSTVLLFLLNTGNLQINDRVFEQAKIINETVPDLKILYATSTNQQDNLWSLVRDMHDDIMTVNLNTEGTNIELSMGPLLERILQVSGGRRVINPICGSEYVSSSSGTRQFDDFVEPGYINYYAVSPNYFYGQNSNRKIRISRTSGGFGSLVVCYSRSVRQPSRNNTNSGFDESGITCQNIQGTSNLEVYLDNPCDGYFTIGSCPSFYLSVQSESVSSGVLPASCTDSRHCRFPFNIRYQVSIEEFGCYNSASTISAAYAIGLVVLFNLLFS